MRVFKFLFLIVVWAGISYAFGLSGYLLHEPPAPVVQGEVIHLELTNTGFDRVLYNSTVFYRQRGESDYKSAKIRDDGIVFSADIPTKNMHSGVVEYYFAFQSDDGQAYFLPENSPEVNPMKIEVLSAPDNEFQDNESLEILLLSPEPDEIVEADEFMLALSLPVETESDQDLKYQLLISGVDVTRNMERDGMLYSYMPSDISGGIKNAEFKVFDVNGNLVGQKSWTFRIRETKSRAKELNARTSVFLNNRYQNISKTDDNFFRGGVQFEGNYKMLDMAARIIIDSEESPDRQPINQYTLNLQYNFSSTGNVYLKAGDVYTNYDLLSYWGRRVRGFGVGLNFKYFGIDFTSGSSARAVEGDGTFISVAETLKDYQISRYGVYKQDFMAIRPEFRFGEHVTWGLNLINAKDDANSIDPNYATNPKEALVIGSTLDLDFDNSRIYILGSFQASMKNEDARGKVEFDTLVKKYDLTGSDKDQAETFFDLLESTGFLTTSQGLSPIPSIAMRFQLRLRYFRQDLTVGYRKVEADYITPGNPYMQKDLSGFHIMDYIRLLNNQIFLNLYFRSFDDNISRGDAKTNSTDFGATISYFPFSNLPSVTLSYNNLSRQNELSEKGIHPDSTVLFFEDNQTQQIGLSSSYKFETGSVKNTATIGITNHKRDDKAYPTNKSDFTMFNIGVRNQFKFPLTTRVTFAQTASGFGADSLESSTDIQKIFLDAQYLISNVRDRMNIRPFVQFNFQNIKNDLSSYNIDYNRVNYAAGVYLTDNQYGTFTLRYDYIDFGSYYNWNDTILSARYDVTF
ncbi:MAG: hypothetical protein JXB44_03865 [Calditrichaceae bacterium]|nr:hypothetical protein [Calditrichaceae bacterium]RQV96453.1 MAG: hypothetical protein EH224_04345 [Calditrichota bacterium]